jgi:UDP-glucuronate decarboxylase
LLNAERHNARILIASTSEVYGDPEVSPQPESYHGNVNTWGPRACYDEGKRAAESLCYEFQSQGRAEVRVARIFNTYGPGMRLDDGRVMTEFIVAALAGQPLRLDANGEQTRTFCYIDDMVEGVVSLMGSDHSNGPINLGGQEEIAVGKLALLIIELTGSASEIVHKPRREDDPMQRKPDLRTAQSSLAWVAKTDLRKGICQLCANLKTLKNQS